MAILSEQLARAGRFAALGQAAANMAHQIGTPLNLISAYVQLLLQSPQSDSARERLKAIQDQIAKVTATVRAALASSRPPTTDRDRVDLCKLIRRVCQMAGPLLEKSGVEIALLTPEEPVELWTDEVQLELALLNLLTNSIDAMEQGGKVTIRLSVTDRICLEIEDTGTGIPADLIAHIFDPWVTTKPAGKGSGLGLSITRQVIANQGGTISASSRPGHGALFTIELPLLDPRPVPRQKEHAENTRR
jgi:signal transduction histidine kinase